MYKEVPVVLYDCECDVCGHTWLTRKAVLPTHCPGSRCSNPLGWNRSEEPMRPEEIVPEAEIAKIMKESPVQVWIPQKPYLDEQSGDMIYCEKHYKTGKPRLVKRVSQYD